MPLTAAIILNFLINFSRNVPAFSDDFSDDHKAFINEYILSVDAFVPGKQRKCWTMEWYFALSKIFQHLHPSLFCGVLRATLCGTILLILSKRDYNYHYGTVPLNAGRLTVLLLRSNKRNLCY